MRNRRLAAAVLCTAVGFAFQWAIVRANYGGNWTALFCHGSRIPLPAGLAFEHIYVFPDSGGYDGQSYHYVAHDPMNRTDIGSAVPDPSRRFPRILVPGLAYLLALGRPAWIDPALFGVNLLFLGLGAYWLACLIPWPMWAVLYVLTPVALISLDRMTVDLALTSLALGFAVYTKEDAAWPLWVIFAAAALCRETGVLLFAAYAPRLVVLGQYRKVVLFGSALIPAAAWNLWTGAGGLGPPVPFYGIAQAILHPRSYRFGVLANTVIQSAHALQLAGLLFAMGLVFFTSRKITTDPVRAACVLFAIFGVCATGGAYDDPFAGVRFLAPLLLFQFIGGDRWGRIGLLASTPRAWLELLPQLLRIAGIHVV